MKAKCAETIKRYGMLSPGDTVIAGLSGGADSMALLWTLRELSGEGGFTVMACHVNHNLRGEESARDERFVRDFCENAGIPLRVFSIDVSGARQKHESLEECARRERYRCFEELLKELPAAKIATAHTATDNAETVLLNILRGTGTKGLCGIPPVRGSIIRPLIRCTREETEGCCRENGIAFVTDSTNLSDDYTRNRLRLKVLPLLKEFNPSLMTGISRMTEAVSEDNAFIEASARALMLSCGTEGGWLCEKLACAEPALLSRAVSLILSESGVEPSSLRINGCAEIIRAGKGKINLCRDKFAVVRKKMFFIETVRQNYRNNSTQFSKKNHTND